MKMVMVAAMAMGFATGAMAEAVITVDRAQQRYPWNGQFDITYTASGVEAAAKALGKEAVMRVWAVDPTTHVTNVAEGVSGEAAMADGTHSFVWDMDGEGIFQGVVGEVEIYVGAWMGEGTREGVQLWEGGPYFAKVNVGAEREEEEGYCFWWGDTVGYCYKDETDGKWVSSQDSTKRIVFASTDSTANQTHNKALATLYSEGWIDKDTTDGKLVAAHDAATTHWGAPWRMMSQPELAQLLNPSLCTFTWTTNYKRTGINGLLLTGTQPPYTSHSIFLPAAGFGSSSSHLYPNSIGIYRTSSPTDSTTHAHNLYFNSTSFKDDPNILRCYGLSIRPVSSTDPSSALTQPLCFGKLPAASDLRTGTIRNAATTETLTYTTNYPGGAAANARVTITVNDAVLASDLAGCGTIAWTPDPNYIGTFTLTNSVYLSGTTTHVTNYVAQFHSQKKKFPLLDAPGNIHLVTLNRAWAEAKTGTTDPTAQTNVLNVLESNHQRMWENTILGLNGSDEASRPVITPIQLTDPTHVGFRLNGVEVDETSGATVSNRVLRGSTPGARDRGSSDAHPHKEMIVEEAPSSGIQYYRLETIIR